MLLFYIPLINNNKMRKKLFLLIIITGICKLNAQTAFHNFGNAQIHDNGKIGFHTNLINDGMFNQNLGLAGFYQDTNPLTISGTEIPRFYYLEVVVDNHLFLEINTEVSHDLDYIIGDIITPRSNPEISLDYLNNAIYTLDDDLRNVDGYASATTNQSFVFPIGQDDKLRPLITPEQPTTTKYTAAYFNEDPNFPSTFSTSFNTNNSDPFINTVNTEEFWDFDGTEKTYVTLTWDSDSQINNLVTNLLNLRVVGWSIADNEWKDLGNTAFTGNLTEGTISSIEFIPNNFEIITFGALIGNDDLVVYNGISPNGDGLNDVFVMDGITLFPNHLKIFNRWGNVVYDAKNYQNDWNGVSNKNTLGYSGKKLPVGTYYYLLELPTENKHYAGWVYINY